MDNESEAIREQMNETRSSLVEKLGALEEQVIGTVENATNAVTSTVENVKETVEETVESVKDTMETTVENVKETLNIRRHVENHPWLMLGGSVAVGFLLGRYIPLPRDRQSQRARRAVRPSESGLAQRNGGLREYRPTERPAETLAAAPAVPSPTPTAPPASPKQEEGPGWLSTVADKFGSEIDQLKGLAIGTALGVVRDMVTRSVPQEIGAQISGVINGFTEKLGGRTLPPETIHNLSGGAEHEEQASTTEARRPEQMPHGYTGVARR
jgi:ElaB/YqjD/DUF883 family membrane-anchored ribosome-binding protein